MKENCKQDKEVGINPHFDEAEAGNPLCPACGTEEVVRQRGRPAKIGMEKRICITDSKINELIEKLRQQPGYKSTNKIINAALFYGLPILAEKVCGASMREDRAALMPPRRSDGNEELYSTVIQLLRETVLNENINKSILSSLYNVRREELAKDRNKASRFCNGLMSDTPEYLERYEADGFKRLHEQPPDKNFPEKFFPNS